MVLVRSFVLSAVLLFVSVTIIYSEEKPLSRSLELSVGYMVPYKETMLQGAGKLGPAYTPMLTYGYLLSEDYQLGIHLLRFNHHYSSITPVYTYSYGFGFKHFLPRNLLDLGLFHPYLSYSIILSQGFIDGTEGRGMAHNTRIGAGTDITINRNNRLLLEAVWDSVDFPGFGNATGRNIYAVSGVIGWRLLF